VATHILVREVYAMLERGFHQEKVPPAEPWGRGRPLSSAACMLLLLTAAPTPCWAQGAQSISCWRMRSARSLCEVLGGLEHGSAVW